MLGMGYQFIDFQITKKNLEEAKELSQLFYKLKTTI